MMHAHACTHTVISKTYLFPSKEGRKEGWKGKKGEFINYVY